MNVIAAYAITSLAVGFALAGVGAALDLVFDLKRTALWVVRVGTAFFLAGVVVGGAVALGILWSEVLS